MSQDVNKVVTSHDNFKAQSCLYCTRRNLFALGLEKDLSMDVFMSIVEMLNKPCAVEVVKGAETVKK